MLDRRRKTARPCGTCGLSDALCICPRVPKLDLQTRLTLVVHHRELKRTTNTGRLAVAALVNSSLLVRGRPDAPLDHVPLAPGYAPVVLYPSDDAVDIRSIHRDKPIQLIVADGNWRQAGKVHRRHPELRDLPRVKITDSNLGAHHLRKEHFDTGFSTLEAIALAIDALEGPAAGRALLDVYQMKLRATLEGRGLVSPDRLIL